MPCIRDDNDENFTPTISDDQSIVSTIADTIADKSDESFDSLLHAATEDRLAATEDDEYGPIESYWFERVAADEDTKIARSTIADDSCDERPRSRSPSGHIDRLFSAEVKYRLCHYDHGQYPWLRTHHVTVQGQRNFEEIVQENQQLILAIATDDYDFKKASPMTQSIDGAYLKGHIVTTGISCCCYMQQRPAKKTYQSPAVD